MTREAAYSGSTPFSAWIRNEPRIDSYYGFNTSDIDYMWADRRGSNGYFMFIEEKCRNTQPTPSQATLFRRLHGYLDGTPMYKGFHVLVFEAESPTDGLMALDGYGITVDELLTFLEFEAGDDMYKRCVL